MRVIAALVLVCLCLFQLEAYAALGEHHSQIESEKVRLKVASTSNSSTAKDYTVTSLQTDACLINEYVNNQGQVFAITWRGVAAPDLSVLLGTHFSEFVQIKKSQARRPGRTPSATKTSKITVKHFGHMRDIRGLAYQQSLVPLGIDPEVLP